MHKYGVCVLASVKGFRVLGLKGRLYARTARSKPPEALNPEHGVGGGGGGGPAAANELPLRTEQSSPVSSKLRESKPRTRWFEAPRVGEWDQNDPSILNPKP